MAQGLLPGTGGWGVLASEGQEGERELDFDITAQPTLGG